MEMFLRPPMRRARPDLTTPLRPIHPRDRELQQRGDRHPDEIGHLGGGYPPIVRPDGEHHPENRAPDDDDVGRRQWQIPHTELGRGEDQIRHEFGSEGQGDDNREPASRGLHEHEAKRRDDDGVEDLPDEADRPRRRRPRRRREALIPVDLRNFGHESQFLAEVQQESRRHQQSPAQPPKPHCGRPQRSAASASSPPPAT